MAIGKMEAISAQNAIESAKPAKTSSTNVFHAISQIIASLRATNAFATMAIGRTETNFFAKVAHDNRCSLRLPMR
jgi:hypothetical protein